MKDAVSGKTYTMDAPDPKTENALPRHPWGNFVFFAKEGVFYLLLLCALICFALFTIKNFNPFIHSQEGVMVMADAEFLKRHIRFWPVPHLDMATNYFVYPYEYAPACLPWILEHDYLCGLCQRLFGYGPWQQLYWLFSLAITSVVSYLLLKWRRYSRFAAGFFALAFAFADFAAICKFPGHYTLTIVTQW